MAGETVVTIVGNLTADPELRTLQNGSNVASFTIASTPRNWNRQTNQYEDGQALFLRCSAWRDMAAHCAQTLCKGMRVIAQGRLQQRSYTAKDGSQRTALELQVDEIGPSLRYATAQVQRQQTGQGFQGGGYQNNQGFQNNNAGAGFTQNGPTFGAPNQSAQPPIPATPSDPFSQQAVATPSNDPWSAPQSGVDDDPAF
ncbi:single-stranded DNA-binding protein [Bifidobacterium oedipodis]|uniref:Single-stranded DNA-binding protein n=1 Tax=Bifidobacterium oedipodis TaxID=2675322 RepID=A0A7Y0HST6_9BIFI|nr:single-stranded DNA-binding protein [Bifidobacterium sp. DSM 109957]NMM93933.1 single-strand-binding family protein [Bifidobacterium sp. DSM 109957]